MASADTIIIALAITLALLWLRQGGCGTQKPERFEDIPKEGVLNAAGYGDLKTFSQCLPMQAFYPITDITSSTYNSTAAGVSGAMMASLQDKLDRVRLAFNSGRPVIFFNNRQEINTDTTVYPNVNTQQLADVIVQILAAQNPEVAGLKVLKVSNIVHDLGLEVGRVRLDIVLGLDYTPPQGMPDIGHVVLSADYNYGLRAVRGRASPAPTADDRVGWYLNRLFISGIDKDRFLYGIDKAEYVQAPAL